MKRSSEQKELQRKRKNKQKQQQIKRKRKSQSKRGSRPKRQHRPPTAAEEDVEKQRRGVRRNGRRHRRG
jgi:hypothetical protein